MQPVVSTYISSDNELTGPFCIVNSAIPTSGISFVSTSLSEIDGDPVDDAARFISIVMDLCGIRNLDMVVIRRPNKLLVVVAVLNNIFPPFEAMLILQNFQSVLTANIIDVSMKQNKR
jgi:hypothetical protein